MAEDNSDSEVSIPVAMVRARWSLRCMARKGIKIEFGSESDVRVKARLCFRVMVRHM